MSVCVSRRLLLVIAASALTGCGRMGPLEPPPDASAVQKPEPKDGYAAKKNVPIKAPDTPFALDFLVK